MLPPDIPTETIPAPSKESAPAAVPDVVESVVLPTAKLLRVTPEAATAGTEMITVEADRPTEATPAPEIVNPAGRLVEEEDVRPVVLPVATRLNPPWLAAELAEMTR